MTTKTKYLVMAVLVGILLPLGWLALWDFMNKFYPEGIRLLMEFKYLDVFLLLLWPSSIFLIGDPTDSNLGLRVVSVCINFLYYLLLGWIIYLAHIKRRLVIITPIILVYVFWLWFICFNL